MKHMGKDANVIIYPKEKTKQYNILIPTVNSLISLGVS